MKEKMIFDGKKVKRFRSNINLSEVTENDWDELIINYQFSEEFLKICRENKYYTI